MSRKSKVPITQPPLPTLKPGRFVVFEGLDGAGTTTQVSLIREWLARRRIPHEITSEPSNGPIGAALRQTIEGRVSLDPRSLVLAFAADRSDHLHNHYNGIVQSLEAGSWVICDRYVLSSLAYQGGDVSMDWIASVNDFVAIPDLTIFVETPSAVCRQRLAQRGAHLELYHDARSLEMVERNYTVALEKYSRFHGALVTVDGTRPPQDVREEVLEAMAKTFPELVGRAALRKTSPASGPQIAP